MAVELRLVERGFFKSPAIKLSDLKGGSKNPPVQVLRTGKFSHPKYGEFEITPTTLSEMKKNFDSKVRGVDVAFDYFHESDKEASGWPTELYLAEDGSELWANVEWTPTAQAKLAEREIRYFSPDFAFQWQDPESGKTYKNVLFGGGLTNRPFVKDMAAIVASENKGDEMDLKEIEAKLVKLAEEQVALKAENAALTKKLAEYADAAPAPKAAPGEGDPQDQEDEEENSLEGLKKKLAESQASNKKLMTEMASLKEGKMLAEKEAKFTLMLTEGKACVAQKEAFIKGDMEAFVKLSQPLNLGGQGHGGEGDNKVSREDRVMKLAEEKVKADAKLPLHEAIKLANAEIKS